MIRLWVTDNLTFIKVMKRGDEMGAVYQSLSKWNFDLGFDVVEIDASERLLDMQVANLAVGVGAVPIEDPVSSVRVLLDFMNEKTCADGMESAGFDEEGIAFFRCDGMNVIRDRAIGDSLFEAFTGCAAFQADVEFGSGLGIGDEPHFGLRFAAELLGDGSGRMNLDRERCRTIEDFDEDGKTFAIG